MKKFISLILCSIMLMSVLVSCQKGDTPANSDDVNETSDIVSADGSETESEWETDENGFVKDTITEDMTYNSKAVKVLARNEASCYCLPKNDTSSGSVIQVEVYKHKLAVEKRLWIELDCDYVNSEWSASETFFTKARSGEAAYDLIETYSLWPIVLAQEGLLKNLNNLVYPKLEMPWYLDGVKTYEQYGSLYFVTNNSNAKNLLSIEVVLVNEDMIEEEGLESPVNMVIDERWTIDEMIKIVKQFNSVAEASEKEVFGLVVEDHGRLDGIYYGAGFSETVVGSDGNATHALNDPTVLNRATSLVDKFVDVFKGQGVYISPEGDAGEMAYLNGVDRVALCVAPMETLVMLTNTDYVTIPLPMYDTDQEGYRCVPHNGIDMWSVPVTATDPELSGVVIEAISSSEYRKVAPYVFDTFLKGRYADSSVGMEIFDIIRESVYTDFGRVGDKAGLCVGNYSFRECFKVNGDMKIINNVFSSECERRLSSAYLRLEEVLKNYRKYSA